MYQGILLFWKSTNKSKLSTLVYNLSCHLPNLNERKYLQQWGRLDRMTKKLIQSCQCEFVFDIEQMQVIGPVLKCNGILKL